MAILPQLIEEDIQEFEATLKELLRRSEAETALILDQGGFLIVQAGRSASLDTTTLCALSAASYAATQGIAQLLSEPNFNSVYQQGQASSLLVMPVDDSCLLAVIFKTPISVGAVRYFGEPALHRLAAQFTIARQRHPEAGLDLSRLNLADPSPLFQRKAAP